MRSFIVALLFTTIALAQSVTTAHNDLSGSSAYPNETNLTLTNVVTGKFGLRCSTDTLDGLVFAQPLFIASQTVSGTVRDLLIVATMHNSIYAFDARSCALLWHSSFGASYSTYPGQGGGSQFKNLPELGILGTPTADVTAGLLYFVYVSSTPTYTLKTVAITTGATVASAVISGQVVGTGDSGHSDSTSGANLLFLPAQELQRPGLRLSGGKVYIAFGGIGDQRPYHGWIFAYRTSDLTQVGIWCGSPNGWGAAPWGGELSIDGSGNVYVSTGNGCDYDGVTCFTNSVVKLSSTLSMTDWFTPSNNVAINASDSDLSANGFVLTSGTLGVIAGKDFNVYSIDTTCMGHLQGSGSGCTLQAFKTNAAGSVTSFSGSYGAAYLNSTLWLPTTAGSIYEFGFSGTFNTTPLVTQTNTYGFPGPAQMSVSSNAAANSILWIVTDAASAFQNNVAGTLRALNAATLDELWNSGSALGNIVKFASPIVAKGFVILPVNGNVVKVFGLIPASSLRGQGALRGNATIR